jgi:hypothetical protein
MVESTHMKDFHSYQRGPPTPHMRSPDVKRYVLYFYTEGEGPDEHRNMLIGLSLKYPLGPKRLIKIVTITPAIYTL